MFKTQEEKLSYALGIGIGKHISSLNQNLNHPALFKGIQDAIAGKEPIISEEEMHYYMSSFEQVMSQKEEEMSRKRQNELFLEENAEKQGIVTLPSGVQYKIVQMGEGKTPKMKNQAIVHYRGFLIDGSEFANTYETGHPQHFFVSDVIQGWQEVLQLMKVGDIWHVYIPADLAYGSSGFQDTIPPDATLAYQIELIGII
jgi:FKBP-type peptidyl-prolyl cis-trans isomerase FklB